MASYKKISRKEFNNNIDWYKNIAWSNLCKLAPVNKGNPSNSDFFKQKDICKEIFLTEMSILQPKVVILLTSDWDIIGINKPSKNNFEEIAKKEWGNGYSSILYKKNGIYYINSHHPQGKPEKSHVESIWYLIRQIEKQCTTII